MPTLNLPFRLAIFLALFNVLSCMGASGTFESARAMALLDTLDAELLRADDIRSLKESSIDVLRSNYRASTDNERRYWLARELYEAYSAYDSDSALHYAEVCSRIASELKRTDWLDEMNLNKAYVLSATGLLDEAQRTLNRIDADRLPQKMKMQYYDRCIFLETHRDQYLGRNAERVYAPQVAELLNKICENLTPDDPEYGWLVGWRSLGDTLAAKSIIPDLEKVVAASSHSSRKDAMDSYMLSRLYELDGNDEGRLETLILSAISDVRACNKEIASLEELAVMCFNAGDMERAHNYITYSLQCANDYKSRVRVGRLASLQEQVVRELNSEVKIQLAKIKRYTLLLLIISVVLLFALIFIYRQMRRLRSIRKALGETKVKLEDRVEELQKTRNELEDANNRLSEMYESTRSSAQQLARVSEDKEKHIANIFTICSSYISKLDEFRKDIYRMLVARRFDDVLELVKSPDLPHSEVKELYANFDRIFLKIYPDFVDDFNTLLRPEERIVLKKGELLTTELRIYALVRLGLNDSVKIAAFLHCSVQTVYNTRQRARNKAIIPKDTFAQAVQSLGKPAI